MRKRQLPKSTVKRLEGRALTVNEARPREPRPAGGGGGGYGGGGGGGGDTAADVAMAVRRTTSRALSLRLVFRKALDLRSGAFLFNFMRGGTSGVVRVRFLF